MIPIVPEDLEAYAAAHSSPEPALLAELAAETRAHMRDPQMMVGNLEGRFLVYLTRLMGARRVLEVGTFTGYSALCLAEGLPADGRVVTCEISEKAAGIARRFWARSPHGGKIQLEMGPALDTIARLRAPFDLVFIDADKASYARYWDACVPLLRPGGVLLADNVLWSGRVLAPDSDDDRAIVAFNQHAARDVRVERVVLSIRDGITLAVKR